MGSAVGVGRGRMDEKRLPPLFSKSLVYFDNMYPSGTIHSPSLARCTANRFRKRHLLQMYYGHVCVAVCFIHFVFETEGISE